MLLQGCATESSRSVTVQKPVSAQRAYAGARAPIAVGQFDNRSNYMRGLFSDGVDRLGSQAKTILIAHLQQTGHFSVLDRDNMKESKQEAAIKKQEQTLKGADYLVTGDVTELGRKEVGDHQLLGILGRGKEQIACAVGFSTTTLLPVFFFPNIAPGLCSSDPYQKEPGDKHETSIAADRGQRISPSIERVRRRRRWRQRAVNACRFVVVGKLVRQQFDLVRRFERVVERGFQHHRWRHHPHAG
ncbi:MAG: CsgG/HfaB family protein [Rhodocyclaceae bacterium]